MEKGSDNQQALILGLQYLVNISYVEADEVLKICLDYWNLFVPDVYTTSQTVDVNAQFSFGPMHTVSCPCHRTILWSCGPSLQLLQRLLRSPLIDPHWHLYHLI